MTNLKISILKLEWKMEPCANSGVMFYVHESPEFKDTYESGPEMQIADLACNDDGRILKCRAGDLYDLISADTEWVNKGRPMEPIRNNSKKRASYIFYEWP